MDIVGIFYREDLKRGVMVVYELCFIFVMVDGIFKIIS